MSIEVDRLQSLAPVRPLEGVSLRELGNIATGFEEGARNGAKQVRVIAPPAEVGRVFSMTRRYFEGDTGEITLIFPYAERLAGWFLQSESEELVGPQSEVFFRTLQSTLGDWEDYFGKVEYSEELRDKSTGNDWGVTAKTFANRGIGKASHPFNENVLPLHTVPEREAYLNGFALAFASGLLGVHFSASPDLLKEYEPDLVQSCDLLLKAYSDRCLALRD